MCLRTLTKERIFVTKAVVSWKLGVYLNCDAWSDELCSRKSAEESCSRRTAKRLHQVYQNNIFGTNCALDDCFKSFEISEHTSADVPYDRHNQSYDIHFVPRTFCTVYGGSTSLFSEEFLSLPSLTHVFTVNSHCNTVFTVIATGINFHFFISRNNTFYFFSSEHFFQFLIPLKS